MAFIDRVVEFPGRVQLTNVSGDIYDMTRAEGTEYTEGTLLNATNLNAQTQLDGTVKTAYETAGMTSGTYQNEMSDALDFMLGRYDVQTSGDWMYTIINGLFIGAYNAQKAFTINTAVGNVYQSSAQSLTYPVTLTAVPYANVTCIYGSYSTWTNITSSNTSGVSFTAMSALSRSSATYRIKALVIGKI